MWEARVLRDGTSPTPSSNRRTQSARPKCGLPMELGQCMDCGAVVGGQLHMPLEGFRQATDRVDQTQTGHVLGDPERQGIAVFADRDVAPPVFIVLRLLTHLAMVLGAEEDEQSLAGVVKPRVTDVGRFLFQHIEKGLEQLRNSLGKSADETTTLIHLVIRRLLHGSTPQRRQLPVQFDEIWSSKEGRNNWEKEMEGMVIDPVLQTMNSDILEVNNAICNDDRIGSNLIMNIVYNDPSLNGNPLMLPQDVHLHCSKFWSCRERISVEYLGNVVQKNKEEESVPLLSKFLKQEHELRMVRLLPEILSLQKGLIKIFHTSQDTREQTIEEFLANLNPEGTRLIFKERIERFLFAWNQLKQSLHFKGSITLPEDMYDDLTMNSDVSCLLPRRQGKGLCATALVNYLITLHNSFVHAMEKLTKEEQKFSINASEVMDLHVITYEMERDLMPIILAGCQYNLESGQETTQEFDLPRIQRQIASRFLQGKPLITLVGLPIFTLAHDRDYVSIFMDIKKRLPQDLLPNTSMDVICRCLNVYSDVCEALHIVDVTLGFLVTSTNKPDYPLSTYIEKDLQMAEDTNMFIVEVLSRCQLKHVVTVWQLLNSLKSEHLLRLQMDPFADVREDYKQPLNQDDQQKLNVFLDRHGTNLLLLELHEMIILKLQKPRSTEDFKPSWSLRDTLFAFLEEKDLSFPELEEAFSEQITLAHCIAVWKTVATKTWPQYRK